MSSGAGDRLVRNLDNEPTGQSSIPARLVGLILRPTPDSMPTGIATGAVLIAVETLAVLLLKQVARENEFGLVYLLGVLVISTVWTFRLALMMSLVSAVAFDYFRTWPTDFVVTVADDGVVIAIFLVVALPANALAGLARTRADEANERRTDADLTAELAWMMLRSNELRGALDEAGRRLAQVLGLSFAAVTLDSVSGDATSVAIQLQDNATCLGTPVGTGRPVEVDATPPVP
jgi:K+-sensing histidine kinase KdpD